MHTHYGVDLRLRMDQLSSYKMQAVQGHGTRENHDSTGFVDNSKIIAQMAPRQVDERKDFTTRRRFERDVLAELPLPTFCIS